MCFVLSITKHFQDQLLTAEEFRRCNELVFKDRKELRQNMINTSLQEKKAVLLLSIMSLIVKKLLKNVTFDQPDVCFTYYEYLKRLIGLQQRHHFITVTDWCLLESRSIKYRLIHTAALIKRRSSFYIKRLNAFSRFWMTSSAVWQICISK